jgi:hypothetical protein
MPDAEEALLVGGGGYTLTDPPAMGPYRQEYRGLAATAFLHERAWGLVDGRQPSSWSERASNRLMPFSRLLRAKPNDRGQVEAMIRDIQSFMERVPG